MPTTIVVDSPLGPLTATATEAGVSRLAFGDLTDGAPRVTVGAPPSNPHLAVLVRELDAYFSGAEVAFTVALDLEGTAFERAVWAVLTEIPWGVTRSYQDLASVVGGPTYTRAVGGANGRNPVAIVVPCHRVIQKGGALGGYAGGLDKKRALLALERSVVKDARPKAAPSLELPFLAA